MKSTDEECRALDWNKTNAELSRQLEVSPETIRQLRKRLGIPPARSMSNKWRSSDGKTVCVKYAHVDWTRPVDQIVKEEGIPADAVYYMRRKTGNNKPRPRIPLEVWRKVDWTKTYEAIAEELRVAPATVAYYAHVTGQPRRMSRLSQALRRAKLANDGGAGAMSDVGLSDVQTHLL